MTAECRPPEGTADGTWHVLRTIESPMVRLPAEWIRNGWNIGGDHRYPGPVGITWRYSHAIDLSPPAAPISDDDLADVLYKVRGEFRGTDKNGWDMVAAKARELLQGGTAPAPAAPDPLQQLRDAVVEKARAVRSKYDAGGGAYTQTMDLFTAVDTLNAAEAPPDPVAELRAAWSYVFEQASEHLPPSAKPRMEAAIAALEAGRGKS